MLAQQLPHQARPVVLDHQQRRPHVDAEIVSVEPAHTGDDGAAPLLRLEGERLVVRIEESVLLEEVVAESFAHVDQRRDRDLGSEHDRPAGGVGRNGAVVTDLGEGRSARGVRVELAVAAAPGDGRIRRAVAGGESPAQFAVPRPAIGIVDGIRLLGIGGTAGVLEVVDPPAPHVGVLDAAEIDPGVRKLMPEERREADVLLAVVLTPLIGGGPDLPRLRLHWVGGRAQRQDVQHHRLHVAVPVVGEEAFARLPAHRHERWTGAGPGPVHSPVERVSQRTDFHFGRVVAVEVLLAGQHPHQQERGIDGGELDILEAEAVAVIQEVIEEALVAGGTGGLRALRQLPEVPQRGEGPLTRLGPADIAPLRADHIGGEAEADGGDAGERAGGPSVRCETGGRVSGLPEEVEAAAGEGIEKSGLSRGQRPGILRRARRW